MKYQRPTAIATCVVCGQEFEADRWMVLAGRRHCCSIKCRGLRARSFQSDTGRLPIHGGCVGGNSTLYKCWASMKARCCYPNNNEFPRYGGAGITLCSEWRMSFAAFRDWALTNGFAPGLQIDRIDNHAGYSPDNCRWVTAKENCLNRDRAIRLPNGESTTDAARRLGVTRQAIRYRVRVMGLTPIQVATMPKLKGWQCNHFKTHIGKWRDE